jgi:4Fe-4S ferredoxin
MTETRKPRAKNPEKVKRFAKHPKRAGSDCKEEPGRFVPIVNAHRCEGKGDCVEVCPYDVFEVGPLEEHVYRAMPALVRLKQWVHGKQTAYTPREDQCQACGLCVVACPEKAIVLSARP